MRIICFCVVSIICLGLFVSGCGRKKAIKEINQEQTQKTDWLILKHPEEPSINISDFKVFIKVFREALEENNWPKIHAMWEGQKWVKETANPRDKHPDVEWNAENRKLVLTALQNCDASTHFCIYETPNRCIGFTVVTRGDGLRYPGYSSCP